jgi:hypothetical protein
MYKSFFLVFIFILFLPDIFISFGLKVFFFLLLQFKKFSFQGKKKNQNNTPNKKSETTPKQKVTHFQIFAKKNYKTQ